jgi:hypothetical protein
MPNNYRTQKDGRALALQMLREIEQTGEPCWLDPELRPKGQPQDNVSLRYFLIVRDNYDANAEEFAKGFFSVVTEVCMSNVTQCTMDLSRYRKAERAGKLDADAPGTFEPGKE